MQHADNVFVSVCLFGGGCVKDLGTLSISYGTYLLSHKTKNRTNYIIPTFETNSIQDFILIFNFSAAWCGEQSGTLLTAFSNDVILN